MPHPLISRRLIIAASLGTALSAWGCDRRMEEGELTKASPSGPDAIVIRVAHSGGKARAYRYPALDSAIWTSAQNVPAIRALLAFDQENGLLAYADSAGLAGWIDLRLGAVRPAMRRRYSTVTTADGWSIYGVSTNRNEISRFTPTGDWSLPVKGRRISQLLPQQDGTLLVLFEGEGASSLVMRLRPPDARWLDSMELSTPQHIARTEIGDRVYFTIGRQLIAVNTAQLAQAANTAMSGDIVSLVPTPSGDRLYVVTKSDVVDVYDRYRGEVVGSVQLPGVVSDLRMDALGRYVLARSALGDTTWVVSTGSNRLLGAVAGRWRDDLPAVGIDGAIAVVQGRDVVFIDPTTLERLGRAVGGARDEWFFMLWNGFRPRAQGIDQPVQFSWRSQDSVMAALMGDSGRIALIGQPAAESAARIAERVPPRIDTARPPPVAARSAWTVSFAVVLNEERARALASEIVVEGERAHVVAGRSSDTQVYRVVLGPYPTRADAERVGRASGRQFWVYDGVP